MGLRTFTAVIVFWIIQCFLPHEKVSLSDKFIIGAGGFFGFILSQYITAISLQYTTPVYFSLISALGPVFVMLLAALFLGEPMTGQKVGGVVLGVVGVGILIAHADTSATGSNNLLGIALALVSILSYSLYLIITRSVAQKYGTVTQMKWIFLFTAMIAVPMGVSQLPRQRIFTSACNWQGIGEVAFLLILATCVCYFFVPFGMKYIRATTVIVYMNLQPIVSSLTAIIVGQDVFTWDKPLAAGLVLLGAYVVTTSRGKDEGTKGN